MTERNTARSTAANARRSAASRDAAEPAAATRPAKRQRPAETLSECVERSLQAYFDDLDGEPGADVYDMVLQQVEEPLLRVVMAQSAGNQSRAAQVLGLNRGTLRKKLRQYGLG